jgi:hypothetical protein
MAIASWHDFTSTKGFRCGTVLEDRDIEARARIVAYMNKFLPKWGLRAIEYDYCRTNPCMLLLFMNDTTLTDTQMAHLYRRKKLADKMLPFKIPRDIIELLIRKSYDLLLHRSFHKQTGKWVHLFCNTKFDTYRECREHIDAAKCEPCEHWEKLWKSRELLPEDDYASSQLQTRNL